LKAEISEKQARSIKYQFTVAKLPLAKGVDDFAFKNTPINEALVRDLAGGAFITQQRNVVAPGDIDPVAHAKLPCCCIVGFIVVDYDPVRWPKQTYA
jgi:hypothetical protein